MPSKLTCSKIGKIKETLHQFTTEAKVFARFKVGLKIKYMVLSPLLECSGFCPLLIYIVLDTYNENKISRTRIA